MHDPAVIVIRLPCAQCGQQYRFAVEAPGNSSAVTVDQVAWDSYLEHLIDVEDLLAFRVKETHRAR